MVICDSAEQARELYRQFPQRTAPPAPEAVTEPANDDEYRQKRVAEPRPGYGQPLNAALILHDEDRRRQRVHDEADRKRFGRMIFHVQRLIARGRFPRQARHGAPIERLARGSGE